MELFYLLCSILSAFFTSLVLSCLLPFRALLRCLCSARSVGSSATTGEDPVSLYEGTVWHERRRPVHHSFRYAVRYALVDIDSAPNVLPDHLSGDEARRIAGTTGPVYGLSDLIFFFLLVSFALNFVASRLFYELTCMSPDFDASIGVRL